MEFNNVEKDLIISNNIIHFVGIGGIGMSSLASLLVSLGFKVQGSDLKESYNTERLRKLGIEIFIGHKEDNIKNADTLVISSAIKSDNPEYVAAKCHNLPIYKRGRILGEIMGFYFGIAVTGSHGKTTTTSLIGEILSYAGLSPTVVVGGVVNSWQNNLKIGKGRFLVSEADESDGSFLQLPSIISVVTNIDNEHLDFYKTHETLINSFITYINKVPFYGKAVICIDDHGVQEVLSKVENTNIISYGFSALANYQALDVNFNTCGTTFSVAFKHKNKIVTGFKSNLHGAHNVLNILAAIIVADMLNIEEEVIKEALQGFKGVKRRFTTIGEYNKITFIDDYAHHPSEIQAVLSSAKKIIKENSRIVSVVQPHRYSRLKDFFYDFVNSLFPADIIYILNIYPAGEPPIEGINSLKLAEALIEKGHNNVVYVKDASNLANDLQKVIKPNDMVIFMGAGDITSISHNVVSEIKAVNKAI